MGKGCVDTCDNYDSPGPYTGEKSNYDTSKFTNQSYLYKISGTRDRNIRSLGNRATVYADADRGPPSTTRTTSPLMCVPTEMSDRRASYAETVERDMGNCVPCLQDTAPAYGPPGAPNKYRSYPVRAVFENRLKWNESFGSPFMNPGGGEAGFPGDLPANMPQRGQGNPVSAGGGNGGNGESAFIPAKSNDRAVYRPISPPPMKHDPVLLGCGITSSGEDQYAHRFTYLNRFFNEEDGEILIQPPKGMDNKQYGQYSDELFKTREDNSDNKISTGIMVNPYTGEMFETFENQMPPPNTDKSILADRFNIVNPKLVWAQGGIDPHAPLRKKKEICKKIPGVDHGVNVWGDQLYADERRARLRELANRDIWMCRDGDLPGPQSFPKEKPAGYVGLVPYYRPTPYLPPTQTLDNKGYVPVSSSTLPDAPSIKSEVFVTKPDLTTCPITFGAGPIGDVENEYVVSAINLKDTMRGADPTCYIGGAYLPIQEYTGPLDTEPKQTLKELMESEFAVPITDTILTQTGGGEYVVLDTTPRDTLKEFMEGSFPSYAANSIPLQTGSAQYVVLDTTPKQTLKEFAESQFPSYAANSIPLQTGSAQYVVLDTTPKQTLKEFAENQFPSYAANSIPLQTGSGQYVVLDTDAKPTLKQFMESGFPAQLVNTIPQQTGGAEYVVQDLDPRQTLKGLMQSQFTANPVQDGYLDGQGAYSGTWVPFQGPLEETRRMEYEYLPAVGRPAFLQSADGVSTGDYTGTGLVTSKQHRGTFETNWAAQSKVSADAEDTSVTWMSDSTRDTRRELAEYTPPSDLAPSYQSAVPRMIGQVNMRCNTDMHEVDDEFLSMSSGFLYPSQQAIIG